ncbi:DMT family transporter [Pseudocolwellia agarivorans]|uniref:DMT family transporter n=1 Tax=Pseudocolwellia agarivorans TaxID=1911682 RepID=UPI000985FE64|nr:SMR family transporter [Pseudocolwellia agarivorans]
MSWFILFIAGLLEAGWVYGIQKSESFTNIPYVILAVVSMVLSLALFSIAIKNIPIAHAYLVWLAVGVISISVVNHYFFEQQLRLAHLFCFGLIFIGVVGLKILK